MKRLVEVDEVEVGRKGDEIILYQYKRLTY
jgi:hypothetical protein